MSAPEVSTVGTAQATGDEARAAPRARRPLADLPAPRGLPLLGHIHLVRPESFHLQLERWARELGTPYRLSFAGVPELWSPPIPRLRKRCCATGPTG